MAYCWLKNVLLRIFLCLSLNQIFLRLFKTLEIFFEQKTHWLFFCWSKSDSNLILTVTVSPFFYLPIFWTAADVGESGFPLSHSFSFQFSHSLSLANTYEEATFECVCVRERDCVCVCFFYSSLFLWLCAFLLFWMCMCVCVCV